MRNRSVSQPECEQFEVTESVQPNFDLELEYLRHLWHLFSGIGLRIKWKVNKLQQN